MKKSVFVISAFCISAVITNAQQPIVVSPKVQEITVYLSGAEIKCKESIHLKRGLNTILFKGLASSLVQNSIQVAVGNTIEIRSVSNQSEQLSPEFVNPEIKLLKDSIGELESQITAITNQMDAYSMEKQTLVQNQHIGSAQTGVSIADLTKAADFFRERTLKINNAITSLNKDLKVLTNLLDEKKLKLKNTTAGLNLTRYNVEALVNSTIDQSADFLLRYLVEAAYWEASYDIVATDISKPVDLKYKAQVYNDTGIDWRDVKLSLSTGDISLNASRPYLTAWTLNYSSYANEGLLNSISQNSFTFQDSTQISFEEKAVSELNTSFEIEQRHTIRTGGEPYQIELKTETLQASFEYLAIPKIELSAFLIAKVIGWEKLNLIDGTANVYYGNSFIGVSNINTRLIGDTLELSLGRDNQIVVSRAKIEDKGNTSVLGGKRSESFAYEIQIRNNKKMPVSLRVQDQVPISQEKEITVDIADISNAELDEASGRLQWMKNLPAGETTRYKIAFTVRYPKGREVNIRKSRVVRTPKYRH